MKEERWQRIEELYRAALNLPAPERAVFLGKADPDLRGDVEALLTRAGQAGGPTSEETGGSTVTQVAVGTHLGPYRIEAAIGAGGMGEVFRATDTRLNRAVAIKVSAEQFSDRFEREARAIARLNHPNICTLHDVGPNYLVMELVEGETLAARLKRGKLAMAQTLSYGAQIANALAAAHAKNIVHRDLKPGNIMLPKAGVKVLDFGLAKSPEDETLTASRVVMGTPAYMAPEQRAGQPCDARTDIYALGLILAECAAGKRGPETGALTGQFKHIVERCLAEDPSERWQSAADIQAQLAWLAQAGLAEPSKPVQRRPLLFATALAAIALLSLLAGIWWTRSGAVATSIHPSQLSILLDRPTDGDVTAIPSVSPGGTYLVYAADNAEGVPMLWVRALNSPEEVPLAGTEGASAPFWSPDSRWIGFFAEGRIKKIAPTGGAAQTIARLEGSFNSGAWGKGEIVFKPLNRSPIFRIPEGGGTPEQITHLDVQRTENSHRGVQFLPDGRRFIFVARCSDRSLNALYLGSLDTGKTKRVMPIDSVATFLPGPNSAAGILAYYRDGALVGRTLNLKDERAEGEPWVILNRVEYQTASIWPFFMASADGSVAIFKSSGGGSELVWHERNGLHTGSFHERNDYFQPRLSPDGKRVLFAGVDPQSGNRDVFIMELDRGVVARLTSHVANDWYGLWSPDGKNVLFASDRAGTPEMTSFLKSADGTGSTESPFFDGDSPTDWTRDGAFIVGTGLTSGLWASEAKQGSKPVAILPRGTGVYPRLSPDGKWIAYTSRQTGTWEVFVRRFTGTADPGEAPLQISKSGGDYPVWNPLGGELFYMSRDGAVWSVGTRDLGRRSVPPPVKLFRACEDTAVFGRPVTGQSYFMPYDTRDGRRFLVTCLATPPGKFMVLLNWPFHQGAQPH
jgi:Tol biopolymer transport system component